MNLSPRYMSLADRVAELRRHFLPDPFSPTGMYADKDLDLARAYRLLVHAEIESYLEDRGREVILSVVKEWESDKKPRAALISLLSFHLWQHQLTAQQIREACDGKLHHLEAHVKTANEGYNRLLGTNNGVKEENVLRILLPLGLSGSDIDRTWLNTLHSFGTAHGETAHTSIGMQCRIDPESELKTVNDIIEGLKDIDRRLTEIAS